MSIALVEMEPFDAITKLETNKRQMIYEYLLRSIELELVEAPHAKHRLNTWQKNIPKNLRPHVHVYFEALAIVFEITGNFIKNTVTVETIHNKLKNEYKKKVFTTTKQT